MKAFARLAIPIALVWLGALAAYFVAPSTILFSTTPQRVARAQAWPPIKIGVPTVVTCTPPWEPTPEPTPDSGNAKPVPRPIETGGQPLVLNPADICPNAQGTPATSGYTIRVKSGDIRVVRRRTLPGDNCPTYEEWYDGEKHETLSTCPVTVPPGPGTPAPTPDPYDPGVWIWFRDPQGGEVEISCGCGAKVSATVTPPPILPQPIDP